MYLKSLVLKGFKSFADRSVMTLEPGIVAIVGPNGSGKSNISDAVLWVLGERSPKNLRGQAMDDIIFAGSAARNAVSMAEVELVLDNSDRTLPVDYDEVSIARRMYRSGESEYLVNGSVVRRLDVLEILHDSGLGTGTHSIISQGSLDSILQSKPEDRRALIEEAAGVLKHKQRKEKSTRKLAAMDNNLARVRDITSEVARQLGPLERKAKRAQAYEKARKELDELELALAVDTLRSLQVEWDKVIASEKSTGEELEERRGSVEAAERKVNEIQEAMRRDSADAGELARKQRRAAQAAERLDGCEMVLRERRRSTLSYQTNLKMSLESASSRALKARSDLDEALEKQEEARKSYSDAQEKVAAAQKQRSELDEKRSGIERDIAENERVIASCASGITELQRQKAALQEDLSSGLAHQKLVEARRHELSANLDHLKEAHEQARDALSAAHDALTALEKEEAASKACLVERFNELEEARASRDSARESAHLTESELKAIEQAHKAERRGNEALEWLVEHASQYSASVKPLVSSVKAKPSVETLVENLLGTDLAALSVDDSNEAATAARLLLDGGYAGDVSLFMRKDECTSRRGLERPHDVGHALIDELSYDEASAPMVEALFGDVVLCDTREDALSAHASDTRGLTFVSRDGCAVWPSGKVRLFGKRSGEEEGVLARERRADELKKTLDAQREALQGAEKLVEETEVAYREAQTNNLALSQQLANQKGVVSAAKTDEANAAQRLQSAVRELEDIDRQVESARSSVSELRPKVDDLNERIEAEQERQRTLSAAKDELATLVAPLRAESQTLNESLTSAKLEEATLKERKVYAERMVIARENDVDAVERSTRKSKRRLAEKTIAIDRASAIIQLIEVIASELQMKSRMLDTAVAESEEAANSVHATAAAARDEARQAHDDYDSVSERMAQVRIEKSRLEVRVDAAVKAVVEECSTPLDKASELPELEDRQAVEAEALKIERRIKNMGAINPDAAAEYAVLKERYDFLSGQLDDMESARRSLSKIIRVIDARMKNDFARTFEEVNANFAEVFSTLFPGGKASLELDDPTDIENCGIEITAQPRGKKLTKMMLMSGGEKSLTALALLFAVYRTRSTPFYILDEVEAALDDTNLRRLVAYINELRDSTQLIMITHQRRTMEMADMLFGVSMQADGVTKVISQKLERALDQAD